MTRRLSLWLIFAISLLIPILAYASTTSTLTLVNSTYGILACILFVLAYLVVISEEFLHMRKSKPVMIAAGLIWLLVALAYHAQGQNEFAATALRANLLEYAELLLFLLAAMTYINAMQERRVFLALRSWLTRQGYSLRTVFWLTGILSFFISSVADNLTTALLMCAVIVAVAGNHRQFLILSCINLVVAANAGGAFSPFGDITTLMVWQKEKAHFFEFFRLFIPSLLNWFIPALLMSFAVPNKQANIDTTTIPMLPGAKVVIGLFAVTILMAVSGHQFLHLPPVLGMMTGLGFLKLYGYFLRRAELRHPPEEFTMTPALEIETGTNTPKPQRQAFDIFNSIKHAEWDTLLFFYGVVLCVGGLGAFGYLALLSNGLYGTLGPTWANISVGIISAVVDNIPVMYAVLNMNPAMTTNEWLLVTLTAGVGGSLLSIGSAAGVALMGQARGVYTFFAHLRWSWAILLGYVVSIAAHLWLNPG